MSDEPGQPRLPLPVQPDRAGCCAYPESGKGACAQPVAWAGLTYFAYSKETWRSFACEEHKLVLIRPERYGSRAEHRAEMAQRNEIARRTARGEPCEPRRPVGRILPTDL